MHNDIQVSLQTDSKLNSNVNKTFLLALVNNRLNFSGPINRVNTIVGYGHRFPEATKWMSQRQRVFGAGLRRPPANILKKTLPPFSNLSCPIPTQPLLHLVQHVADWIVPFPRSQNRIPSSSFLLLHAR